MRNEDLGQTQLELGLHRAAGTRRAGQRRTRSHRAAWWFAQMRRVVDEAVDWSRQTAPRPEQMVMPNSHRRIELAPR